MTPLSLTLDMLNRLDEDGFVQALDGVFEHAPWVAAAAVGLRPFATVADLHAGMMQAIQNEPQAGLIAFLNRHPELGGSDARAGNVTCESAEEQAGLGVDRLAGDAAAQLDRLNVLYRERFGFPFVICVRRQTQAAVHLALRNRLSNGPAEELATAVTEIGHITRLRIADRVSGPGALKVAGRLSVHVLDTHSGCPAVGVKVELFEHGPGTVSRIAGAVTNQEGRTDAPLLADGPLRIGRYELIFGASAYFRDRGIINSPYPFLDEIAIRFGIDAPEGHLHVPLVMTPWSYATYRGS